MTPTKYTLLATLLITISTLSSPRSGAAEPLWELGLGVGAIRFEQYPASSQFSELVLPFPTFQFRGKTVRADDRDGARAYLIRSKDWFLEFSGGVIPALTSADNQARTGMEPLPWMIELGPQIVKSLNSNLELKSGLFQAISTDGSLTRTRGGLWINQLVYKWGDHESFGRLSWSLKLGSKDFLATYYAVTDSQAASDRPTYEAREGFFSDELSYFQAFNSGRASFYVGAGLANYDISANRASPLHRSDHNLTYYAGITYTLMESPRPATSEEETQGIINRLRPKYREWIPL